MANVRKLRGGSPKKAKKKSLAPRSKPTDPGETNGTSLSIPRRIGGMYVNEATALTCASVWACVRVISEGLAKLPWPAYKRRSDGGRDRAADSPADWLLNIQANPETGAFVFRETLLAHALTWGNGFAEIERDILGRPVWLWILTPDRVTVDRDSRGRIVYDVSNANAPNTALGEADVFHLKGLGFDGLVGYSVIRMHARTIGGGLAADKAANDLFENDTTPGGILTHPGRLSDKARQNLLDSWQRRHGNNNRRMLGILEEGMKWAQTALPPEDLQLLQTRQWTPLEVCRIFRVQPHKIAELTRATFSNIEEQNREHVEDTLMPWAIRGEQEANIKLFLPNAQRRFYTKHNFNALLRGNATQRADFYTKMFYLGMSPNEIFELEDMNPVGPDGDKRFVPQNLQLLEKAGEEPEQPEPINGQEMPDEEMPEDMPANEMPEDDMPMEEAARMLPLLEDLCGRILHKETKIISDSARTKGDFNGWLARFTVEHEAHLREALQPAFCALIPQARDLALTIFLADYLPMLAERCKKLASGEDAAVSPAVVAKQLIAAATAANVKRLTHAG